MCIRRKVLSRDINFMHIAIINVHFDEKLKFGTGHQAHTGSLSRRLGFNFYGSNTFASFINGDNRLYEVSVRREK